MQAVIYFVCTTLDFSLEAEKQRRQKLGIPPADVRAKSGGWGFNHVEYVPAARR